MVVTSQSSTRVSLDSSCPAARAAAAMKFHERRCLDTTPPLTLFLVRHGPGGLTEGGSTSSVRWKKLWLAVLHVTSLPRRPRAVETEDGHLPEWLHVEVRGHQGEELRPTHIRRIPGPQVGAESGGHAG